MASKKKGKTKGKRSKTSSVKLSNKHLNKLGKQGKLKQEAHKRKLKEKKLQKFKAKKENIYEEDGVGNEIGEEDIGFYGKGQDSSFISRVKNRVLGTDQATKSKKRKRDDEDTDQEDYERFPRKQFQKEKKKMILPIKTKKGIVPQAVDYESEEENDEEGAEQVEDKTELEEEPEPLPVLSGVDLFVNRQKKLTERKHKIAVLASAITENPEENIKKLRELVSMLKEKDPDVFVTVRKYVMVSLVEIFKDIIPGYVIRLPTEQEQQQKMKKDTKSLIDYEISLLRCYKDYLEFLDLTAKGSKLETKSKKKQPANHRNHVTLPQKSQQVLTELSVKCLCDLLTTHPHFNYRNNIIRVIVPYMNRHSEVSDIACSCVRQCFQEDKAGNVTLELTKCIGKMIKAREYKVKPKVLETFLSLKIKEVSYTDPLTKEENEKEKKNHQLNDKLSRREKKKKKKMMFLEKDLQETKATEDRKMRLKLHTETIQAVFLTYFRILKKATDSVLFPCVLEGLAKFAHLISVDFFDDLFIVFNKLIAEEELSYRESLHCVQTAFTILSGQGTVLNIDPVIFYKHLYKNLFNVHAGCTSADVSIVLQCLDMMISKRKRQVSQQRVLAFIKRLSMLSLQQTSAGAIGVLSAVRSFLLTYNYTDILLDNEAQGSGVYLPELDDPEHCNAHNSCLWELTTLQHHYDPVVRKLSSHLAHGAPTTGDGLLPGEFRKPPLQMFQSAEHQEPFSRKIPEKLKLKKRKFRGDFLQDEVKDKVLSVLSSVPDEINDT